MHVGAGQSRSVADACHISRDSDRTYMEQKRAFAHHCGNAGQLRKGQKRELPIQELIWVRLVTQNDINKDYVTYPAFIGKERRTNDPSTITITLEAR